MSLKPIWKNFLMGEFTFGFTRKGNYFFLVTFWNMIVRWTMMDSKAGWRSMAYSEQATLALPSTWLTPRSRNEDWWRSETWSFGGQWWIPRQDDDQWRIQNRPHLHFPAPDWRPGLETKSYGHSQSASQSVVVLGGSSARERIDDDHPVATVP